jgi:hypothetical protein
MFARLLPLVFLLGCTEPKQPEPAPQVATDSTECTVTCPKCGFKKKEIMPTDVCVGKYVCKNCDTLLIAKDGDCCVYCSYSDKVCPPEQ